MGCKPCPHHCPRGPGGLLAVLGLVLAAVLAVILGQVLASVFAVLMAAGGVIGAAGIANLAYILRRDRWQPAEPREPRPPRVVARAIPQRQAQAISTSRRSAAALPATEAPRLRLTGANVIRISEEDR